MTAPSPASPLPIQQVLQHLGDLLEHSGLPLVEQWDEDVGAVGLAFPDGGERIVFIASSPGVPGRYDATMAPGPARFRAVDFETLVGLVRAHLEV